MCHCANCQRRTGSVFGIAAFFDRGAVSLVQGASKTYTRDSASGKHVTFHFCPECGSTIFWEPERLPHLIGVAVGALADPSFPQPQQSVWTDMKHAWLGLPKDITQRA
nr:GFA family protein [Bradyrhizobium sp.]